MNRYSTLGVPKLADKRVSMASAFGHGAWSFMKHYIFKLGFIDGWAGFVIAFGNFEGTFYRYAKRYEETQDWQPPASQRSGARQVLTGLRCAGKDCAASETAMPDNICAGFPSGRPNGSRPRIREAHTSRCSRIAG